MPGMASYGASASATTTHIYILTSSIFKGIGGDDVSVTDDMEARVRPDLPLAATAKEGALVELVAAAALLEVDL